MKIKKGDYIRTYDGFIGKLKYVDHMGFGCDKYIFEDSFEEMYDDDIKLVKKRPIDLIEVGDLLRIKYYSSRYNKRVTRLFEVTFKDKDYINLSNAKCEFMLVNGEFNQEDKKLKPIIKSIITKEQLEYMEYKVVK